MKRSILGLALTGGKSSRMGEDKARMRFHGEVDQLDHCLKLLSPYCNRLGISARIDQVEDRLTEFDAEYITDAEGISGPMAGVVAGLRSANGLPVLAVACDMPLLDRDMIFSLVSRRNPDALATCFLAADGGVEPMCCIYEASGLSLLESQAKEGSYGLRRFLKLGNVETLSYDKPMLLANVNTPEQAAQIRKQIDT